MTTITSKQSIAQDADEKAAAWVRNPAAPKPVNPFCEQEQPDHFREWNKALERYLVVHSCPECEASA